MNKPKMPFKPPKPGKKKDKTEKKFPDKFRKKKK